MKKCLLSFLMMFVVIASGCVNGQPSPAANQTPSGTNAVAILDFAFSPSPIAVKAGEAVAWTNMDSNAHQIASDPHPLHTDLPALNSGILSQGQSFSFVFDSTGTFVYHCHLHPNMKGRIIVE